MVKKIKKELYEFKVFFYALPASVTALLVLTVFSMNLLANKSINMPFSWMALDCGTLISWIVFLIMDTVTKHFGPKAATELSVFAIILNTVFCIIFFLASLIPGVWGESAGSDIINIAINKTFGGTWYVLLGSTIAFLISAVVNNFSNYGIGKIFKKNPDAFYAYFLRVYISTAIGQFVDNFTFSFLVGRVFFGWSIIQCVGSAATTMIAELLFELLFAHFGFKICRKWKNQELGKEYFELRKNV